MPAPDFQIIAGTTFGFDATWEDGNGNATNITGCSVRFQVSGADGSVLVDCSSENDLITIDAPETGHMDIQIKPEQTKNYTPEQWLDSRYELRVYFPSGDVYSILRGFAELIRGAIND